MHAVCRHFFPRRRIVLSLLRARTSARKLDIFNVVFPSLLRQTVASVIVRGSRVASPLIRFLP